MITIDKIILNIQEELNKDILLKIFYENNLLNIDLSKLSISAEEIQEVMEKYKIKHIK